MHALLQAGAYEVRLFNRTRRRADQVAAHFGARVRIGDWDERREGSRGVAAILSNIVGRKAASIEGYAYSSDLKALGSQGFVWTEENLNKYLSNVKDVVAHGKMVFPGLKDDQDRKDLIAYLKKFSN